MFVIDTELLAGCALYYSHCDAYKYITVAVLLWYITMYESATFRKGCLENVCFANGKSENVLVRKCTCSKTCVSKNFKYKQKQ